MGPVEPTEIRDLAQFEAKFGTRTAGNIALWDALDVFFREGGKRAYVCKGTAPTLAATLAKFHPGLGPGSVSAVGFPLDATGATIQALWAHAPSPQPFRDRRHPGRLYDGRV